MGVLIAITVLLIFDDAVYSLSSNWCCSNDGFFSYSLLAMFIPLSSTKYYITFYFAVCIVEYYVYIVESCFFLQKNVWKLLMSVLVEVSHHGL